MGLTRGVEEAVVRSGLKWQLEEERCQEVQEAQAPVLQLFSPSCLNLHLLESTWCIFFWKGKDSTYFYLLPGSFVHPWKHLENTAMVANGAVILSAVYYVLCAICLNYDALLSVLSDFKDPKPMCFSKATIKTHDKRIAEYSYTLRWIFTARPVALLCLRTSTASYKQRFQGLFSSTVKMSLIHFIVSTCKD